MPSNFCSQCQRHAANPGMPKYKASLIADNAGGMVSWLAGDGVVVGP